MVSQAAAEILAKQRLSLSPINLEVDQRPADEGEAYDLQSEVNAVLAKTRLGMAAGHKIGCTTPVMQKFLGIANPCAGQVFANTVFSGAGVISRAGYRKLGVECEIAVEIGSDIEPQRHAYTRQSVSSHVQAVMAGIEIVDDRYADYRSLGACT